MRWITHTHAYCVFVEGKEMYVSKSKADALCMGRDLQAISSQRIVVRKVPYRVKRWGTEAATTEFITDEL